MTPPLERLIAGAVFDFAGYLSTRPGPITMDTMLAHVKAWAGNRNLPLQDAMVTDWDTHLPKV